jgi:peptidoglycan hydrolase-like protein with peptidoglycan-binding domain
LLQADLNTLGANPKLEVDGRLGPATAAAVTAFQSAVGVTPDGIAGPLTLAAIKERVDALAMSMGDRLKIGDERANRVDFGSVF